MKYTKYRVFFSDGREENFEETSFKAAIVNAMSDSIKRAKKADIDCIIDEHGQKVEEIKIHCKFTK